MRKLSRASTNSDGEDGAKCLAEGFGAAEGVHGFHLRVPALDAVVEIDGEDADVDGFDDVLVEFLEPLELADLFFEARVEAGVLQGDADVAGERFEQLHVFAGEEVAADGAAQADDGDGAAAAEPFARSLTHAAGQVVVQVEQRGGALLLARQMQGLLGIFKEDVRVVAWRWSKSRKPRSRRSAVLALRVHFGGQAVGSGQAQAA